MMGLSSGKRLSFCKRNWAIRKTSSWVRWGQGINTNSIGAKHFGRRYFKWENRSVKQPVAIYASSISGIVKRASLHNAG